MVILPTVAQVAADEPEMAANTIEAATFTCSRRPGSGDIQGASPRNMYSEIRERNNTSPIQINSGKAVKVQAVTEPNTVVAMASPGSRVENNSMASSAVPVRARPIHTPSASSPSSAPMMIKAYRPESSAVGTEFLRITRAGHRPARRHQREQLQQRQRERHCTPGHGTLRQPHRQGNQT